MNKPVILYEKEYFTKHYLVASDFSRHRFKENCNWFRGIFNIVDPLTNVLDGRGKTALEFGCATGAASRILQNHGYNVLATDNSSYSISKAKKLNPSIKFIKKDIQKENNFGNKFDLVFALDVIEHLEDPQKAIRNVYKLVKSGGMAIFTTPNDYEHERNLPTHINVKKPEEWRKILLATGFKKIIIFQKSLLPYFYRFHWKFLLTLPVVIKVPGICSPVFIIAYKN